MHGDRVRGGEVFVVRGDGTHKENLTKTDGALEGFSTFSPDGTKIAFYCGRSSFESNDVPVWVANADGSGRATKLISTEQQDGGRFLFLDGGLSWQPRPTTSGG